MRNVLVLLSFVTLAGCASLEPQLTCAAGEEPMRTAQLFFGQNISGLPGVSDADFRKFTDEVLTPRFPEGLTVLDGGGQWTGPENKLIREAAKVVVLVLPKEGGDTQRKLGEVRQAYIQRFHQDRVMMISQRACISY